MKTTTTMSAYSSNLRCITNFLFEWSLNCIIKWKIRLLGDIQTSFCMCHIHEDIFFFLLSDDYDDDDEEEEEETPVKVNI